MWVFEEEYYIIHDYLLPGFYIAVQFFFTLTFTLTLVSALMSLALFRFDRDDDRYVVLLLSNGASLVAGCKYTNKHLSTRRFSQVQIDLKICIWSFTAIFGLIACITWGFRGDGRDWMPNWEHNDMGFAFALACVGVCFLLPCGVLYISEARRERYKRLNDIGTREASAYSIGEDIRRYQQRQADHANI